MCIHVWISSYLRLVFPTLQQNSSPLSVMTTFMETLGRKIDQADREKAWVSYANKTNTMCFPFCLNVTWYAQDRLLQKKTDKADQNHSWLGTSWIFICFQMKMSQNEASVMELKTDTSFWDISRYWQQVDITSP